MKRNKMKSISFIIERVDTHVAVSAIDPNSKIGARVGNRLNADHQVEPYVTIKSYPEMENKFFTLSLAQSRALTAILQVFSLFQASPIPDLDPSNEFVVKQLAAAIKKARSLGHSELKQYRIRVRDERVPALACAA
jgi:hypothetical protein